MIEEERNKRKLLEYKLNDVYKRQSNHIDESGPIENQQDQNALKSEISLISDQRALLVCVMKIPLQKFVNVLYAVMQKKELEEQQYKYEVNVQTNCLMTLANERAALVGVLRLPMQRFVNLIYILSKRGGT